MLAWMWGVASNHGIARSVWGIPWRIFHYSGHTGHYHSKQKDNRRCHCPSSGAINLLRVAVPRIGRDFFWRIPLCLLQNVENERVRIEKGSARLTSFQEEHDLQKKVRHGDVSYSGAARLTSFACSVCKICCGNVENRPVSPKKM